MPTWTVLAKNTINARLVSLPLIVGSRQIGNVVGLDVPVEDVLCRFTRVVPHRYQLYPRCQSIPAVSWAELGGSVGGERVAVLEALIAIRDLESWLSTRVFPESHALLMMHSVMPRNEGNGAR